jgi:biotin transporter BioY
MAKKRMDKKYAIQFIVGMSAGVVVCTAVNFYLLIYRFNMDESKLIVPYIISFIFMCILSRTISNLVRRKMAAEKKGDEHTNNSDQSHTQ